MRLTTAFNKLLRLPGVFVTAVTFEQVRIIADVRLTHQRLTCPKCGWSTRARHNWQPNPSTWRSLDLGAWRVIVRAHLRRLDCPEHGVTVEAVPFARHHTRFTRDFEDLVAW
ncbi:MAG: transposase family protein [Egibacteraceae bacterium]